MKFLTLILTFALSAPFAMATDSASEPVLSDPVPETNVQRGDREAEEDSSVLGTMDQDENIQREEDFETQTMDGKELEYDSDVIGDDEIEIED